MIRLGRRFKNLTISAVFVAAFVWFGHHLGRTYSPNYNTHIGQVSNILQDYLHAQFNYTIDISNGAAPIELKFKGVPPKEEATKQDIIDWNMELLENFINEPVSEPRVDNLVHYPDDPKNYNRANATLVILVRNKELQQVRSTIVQIESKFNNKFHYPYVFLNDAKFSRKFMNAMKDLLPYREIYFERIEPSVWDKPDSIERLRERKGIDYLKKEKIGYAGMESYHNMCRFYSGNFYNTPRMQKFKWYWRFEPGTNYFCDIDYDVFKFMEDNGKTYGFNIALYDAHQTVKSLWTTTLKFLTEFPQYLHPNGAFNFLTEDLLHPEKAELTQGYSTCHFWSNFEIGDMDFFRGDAYNNWFKYLDATGGFYYERWGDAPVHSVGLSLFEDKSKIHWFRDIGYEHHPYVLCPNSEKCSTRQKGEKKSKSKTQCELGRFTFPHLYDQLCLPNWIRYEMGDDAMKMY